MEAPGPVEQGRVSVSDHAWVCHSMLSPVFGLVDAEICCWNLLLNFPLNIEGLHQAYLLSANPLD